MSGKTGRTDATLHLDGWHGRTESPVTIIGETPTRYRITATERTRLGGRRRYLEPDGEALVPKRALTLSPPKPKRTK